MWHPLEWLRYHLKGYDQPGWRTRLFRPFIMEFLMAKPTLIEREWVDYSMNHPLQTSIKVYQEWVAAGRPSDIAWLNDHPDAPSWCRNRKLVSSSTVWAKENK